MAMTVYFHIMHVETVTDLFFFIFGLISWSSKPNCCGLGLGLGLEALVVFETDK